MAFRKNVLYDQTCCDMIALKRRLLYRIDTGFSWSECQVRNYWRQVTVPITESTKRSGNDDVEVARVNSGYTRESCTVTACRAIKKCEKEAAFFMAHQIMRITLEGVRPQISRSVS